MPTVDTVEKSCTAATDDQRFLSYTACTFEWQIDVYPRVIQHLLLLFTTVINGSINNLTQNS